MEYRVHKSCFRTIKGIMQIMRNIAAPDTFRRPHSQIFIALYEM
jgi:hypothetical protein